MSEPPRLFRLSVSHFSRLHPLIEIFSMNLLTSFCGKCKLNTRVFFSTLTSFGESPVLSGFLGDSLFYAFSGLTEMRMDIDPLSMLGVMIDTVRSSNLR